MLDYPCIRSAKPKDGIPNDKIWQDATRPEQLSVGYQQVNLACELATALHLSQRRLDGDGQGKIHRQDGGGIGSMMLLHL